MQPILEMMDDFAERHGCRGYMSWAKEPLASYTTEYPYRIN
jgi:hypothetical protein